MKLLSIIPKLLLIALLSNQHIIAMRAGAGARAGLPNLSTLLKLDRNDEEDISLDSNVIKQVRKAYLKKQDHNTRRKLIEAFTIYAQKQTLGQNIYSIDLKEDNDHLTKAIDSDPQDIGEEVAQFMQKANEAIAKAKHIQGLGEDEDDNEDFIDAKLYAIAKTIIAGQFKQWLSGHPAKAHKALLGYQEEMGS